MDYNISSNPVQQNNSSKYIWFGLLTFIVLVALGFVIFSFSTEKKYTGIEKVDSEDHSSKISVYSEEQSIEKEDNSIWEDFNQKNENAKVFWSPDSERPARIYGTDISATELGVEVIDENSIEQAGKNFISNNEVLLKVDSDSLTLKDNTGNDRIEQVTYEQTYNGLPIEGSFVNLGFVDDQLSVYQANYFDVSGIETEPVISLSEAEKIAYERFAPGKSAVFSLPVLVIYPLQSKEGIKYSLSYKVELPLDVVEAKQYTVYVDAINGEVIDYVNNVMGSVSGRVTGNVFPEHTSQNQIEVPFSSEEIFIEDISTNTNSEGFYSFNLVDGSVELKSSLAGPWVKVVNDGSAIRHSFTDLEIVKEEGKIKIYVSDSNTNKIYRFNENGEEELSINTSLDRPSAFAIEENNNNLYYSGYDKENSNYKIKSVNLEDYMEDDFIEMNYSSLTIDFRKSDNSLYYERYPYEFIRYAPEGVHQVIYEKSIPSRLYGVDFNDNENISFLADYSNRLTRVNLNTLEKEDVYLAAKSPSGVVYEQNDTIYYVETFNGRIKVFDMSTGVLSTLVDKYQYRYFVRLKFDEENSKFYFLSYDGRNMYVARTNLDGGGFEELKLKFAESGGTFYTAAVSDGEVHNWNWDAYDDSDRNEESNVFYHTNIVHDYFKILGVNEIDTQFTANVNIPSTCNAYYTSNTINFFMASTGCENTALLSDVIYHEYTHGVVEALIKINFPYWGETGNMNEAWADYFGATINNNSCVGEGFLKNDPNRPCLRNIKNNMKWPKNYHPEPHTASGIVAGSLWDLREMIGKEITDKLAVDAIRLQPPTFKAFLENMLIADDDNHDLTDGTPHLFEICTAFQINHGISSDLCLSALENSRIVNKALGTTNALLSMKIQKLVNSEWVDYKVDIDNSLITIAPESSLSISNIFNSLNISISEDGEYRLYASLLNSTGSVLKNPAGNDIYSTSKFDVE